MAMSTDLLVVPGGVGEEEYALRAEALFGAPAHQDGAPPFVGNCVLVVKPDGPGGGRFEHAPFDHPNIQQTRDLFETWPEARDGFGSFVNIVWPLETVPRRAATTRGCTSGHEIVVGTRCAYVTVFDPYGTYEGLLHEWAHLRCLALGIGLETHDGEFLCNGDDELCISAIRKDKRRPMSACLHALLAWAYLTRADLILADLGHADDVRGTVKWNVPKLMEGLLTMKAKARWTTAGGPFGERLIEWVEEIVEGAWDLLGDGERESALAANREWVESTNVPESPLHGTEVY